MEERGEGSDCEKGGLAVRHSEERSAGCPPVKYSFLKHSSLPDEKITPSRRKKGGKETSTKGESLTSSPMRHLKPSRQTGNEELITKATRK